MGKEILPGVVTVYNPDPVEQISEVKKLGIFRIALFLSGASFPARQVCFKSLESLPDLVIPFVHARSDMQPEEFEYLHTRFQTQMFNLHPEAEFPLEYDLSQYKSRIYIENSDRFEREDIPGYAGVCLDLSHLEEWFFSNKIKYQKVMELINIYLVGVSHVSAVRPNPVVNENGGISRDNHTMTALSEFNYLQKFPARYFGKFIAIELLNPIKEQLRLADYLRSLLAGKL